MLNQIGNAVLLLGRGCDTVAFGFSKLGDTLFNAGTTLTFKESISANVINLFGEQ